MHPTVLVLLDPLLSPAVRARCAQPTGTNHDDIVLANHL